ncbi:tyrosine-protein phosphatase [Floccifex sp.]|uniref:tyrosine-protein phosphatase n=1 Tax=Floccifex sp. TaxID=2815810 RepID=UPI003F11A62F
MIDIHSHIVWGIDDGMPSEEDMKIAFQMAKEDGIKIICSTPHFIGEQLTKQRFDFMRKQQREARKIAREYGIQLAFGCELFLNTDVYSCLRNNLFDSLNQSRYLLCEFDVRKDIHKIVDFNEFLYEIEINGYVPCIAHVERYFGDGLDYEILNDWKQKGYVFQVNRSSLLGIHGETIEKNAWELLKKGYVHVIASDCHRANGRRISCLSDVYEMIKKKIGQENADLLCQKNPFLILSNQEVIEMKPKKGFFWR